MSREHSKHHLAQSVRVTSKPWHVALVSLVVTACGGGEPVAGATELRLQPLSDRIAPGEQNDSSATLITRSLRAAYVLARQKAAGPAYALDAGDRGVLVANNPGQGFGLWFGPERITVHPKQSDWSLGLKVAGYGCVNAVKRLESTPPKLDHQQPNMVWHDYGVLEAWHLNGPLGLEQGFEVHAAPAHCDGPIRIAVSTEGLNPAAGADTRGEVVVLLNPAGQETMHVDSLYVLDAEGRELPARLRAVDGNVVIDIDAGTAAYPLTVDPLWSQQQKLTASDGAANDDFGASVSVSGDTAVVGAPEDDDNGNDSGSAYVFVRDSGSWSEQQKLTASDGATNDDFGISVSVSGDTAVVGAPQNDGVGGNSGAVYVFVRDSGSWSEQQKLTASDEAEGDGFGVSVSVSGDTAVVGAPSDDDNGIDSGSVYVFVRNSGSWSEQQKLTASDAAATDRFGFSLSVSGDTAVVGSFLDDDNGSSSGSAYVFVRNSGSWAQEQKLTASDGSTNDNFGFSVSVSGDTAVVGSPSDDDGAGDSGSAYVFVRNSGSWSEEEKLTASDGSTGDNFGDSVSISGDSAVVGALGDDDNGSGSGSAYVFIRESANWSQQQKLTAFDASAGDRFSRSVSVSGDTLVVGSPEDDGSGGTNSGSVYVFTFGTVANGNACISDDNCESGFCVDSVCCDSACGNGDTNDCVVCNLSGSGGICTSLPSGDSCGDATTTECNAPDTCDGSGNCVDNLAAVGEPCGNEGDACAFDDACDGNGACTDNGLRASGEPGDPVCAPYLCDGTVSGCPISCALDTDCSTGNYCDGSSCVPLLVQGATCSAGNQCATGNCVDGVCCNSACGNGDSSDCQACNVSGSEGLCSPQLSGTECRPAVGECDVAESCDGTALECPADGFAADGLECDASGGSCQAGVCTPMALGGDSRANGYVSRGDRGCQAVNGSAPSSNLAWFGLLSLALVTRRRRVRA